LALNVIGNGGTIKKDQIWDVNAKQQNQRCKPSKRLNRKGAGQESEEGIINSLEDIGREQFFRHYPKSDIPIRDITKKPEPHIEIGAENYLRTCYHPNIRGFCQKYLFLCTTCRNREVENGKLCL
jgi:hypothetical protein